MILFRYVLILGFIVFGPAAGSQAASGPFAHAPAGAVLALSSTDIGQTCEAFQQTRLGETFSGAKFAPLIEQLRQHQLGGPLNLRPIVGFDWSDLVDVHSAAGLFILPLSDGQMGLVWIFSGDATQGSPGPLAAAETYFTSQKFVRTTQNDSAAKLTVWTPPAQADAKQQAPPRVIFVADGFYGVANSPAAASAMLDLSSEASLAHDPLWQQAEKISGDAKPSSTPGELTLLVRPFELWELIRSSNPPAETTESESNDEPSRDPLASSRQLGFDGVKAIVGRLSFTHEGPKDWEISARLIATRPYEGALRLLDLQPGTIPEMPDFVSADMTGISFWNWNFPIAMRGFGNLYDEGNEPGPDGVGLFEDMLDGLRDDPEGVQVDLRREVFQELGPSILSIADQQGPKSEEKPDGERTLYVAQVRDAGKVAQALSRFYQGDDRVTHEKVGEYDIWTVPEGSSLFVEGESDSVVSVRALALGAGRMLFGTEVDQLSTALNGSAARPLKSDPIWMGLWKELREGHPTAGLWSLTRLDAVMRPAYEQAVADKSSDEPSKEEGALATLWRIVLFGTADVAVQVPNRAAPKFEELQSALPPASVVMAPSDQDWTLSITVSRSE